MNEVDGHNELLLQMLGVMEPLVSYVFYSKDDEITEIIGFLINIIDGKSDRPKPSKHINIYLKICYTK